MNILKATGWSVLTGTAIWFVLVAGFLGAALLGFDARPKSFTPVFIICPILPFLYFIKRFPFGDAVQPEAAPPRINQVGVAFGAMAYGLLFLFLGVPVIITALLDSNWLRVALTPLILSPAFAVGFLPPPVWMWRLRCHADPRIKRPEDSQQSPAGGVPRAAPEE